MTRWRAPHFGAHARAQEAGLEQSRLETAFAGPTGFRVARSAVDGWPTG